MGFALEDYEESEEQDAYLSVCISEHSNEESIRRDNDIDYQNSSSSSSKDESPERNENDSSVNKTESSPPKKFP